MTGRYEFSWGENTIYAHALQLVTVNAAETGCIIDVGCGFGAIAEPLRERGYTYVGLDIGDDGLASLSHRGFETAAVDLHCVGDLADILKTSLQDRALAAITMLDTLEHITNGPEVLRALRDFATAHGGAPLVLSVPNVTHFDVAAKLLHARWDVTRTGLLDDTHVAFYSAPRLATVTAEAGWALVDSNDFHLPHSDQHFPADMLAFRTSTNLHRFLRQLRDSVDPAAEVNQFVRVYSPGPVRRPEVQGPEPSCFLSVLIRTQGLRPESLQEVLLCLAGQTDTDFEVIVLAHGATAEAVADIRRTIDELPAYIARRTRLEPLSSGGGRARPLNIGVALARGEYIAVIDDDDHVLASYVEEFHRLGRRHPGRMLRAVVAEQDIVEAKWPDRAGFVPTSGVRCPYPSSFHLVDHLFTNYTPLCGVAFPTSMFRHIGVRFDEDLPVLEDWDVILQCAMLCGVSSTPAVTSIYHRWRTGESSSSAHTGDEWAAARHTVIGRLDQRAILMPPGAVSQLRTMHQERHDAMALADELGAQLGGRQVHVQWLEEQIQAAHERKVFLESKAHELGIRLEAIHREYQRSTSWRITRPVRGLSRVLRRVLRKAV